MGVIAVVLPIAITVVGVWYVRDFKSSISNMSSQVFDVMEIVDVLSSQENSSSEENSPSEENSADEEDSPSEEDDKHDRPVIAGVLRRELERLQRSARWLIGGVVGVGVVATAALLVAIFG